MELPAERYHKGWAKPGPTEAELPGTAASGEPAEDESLDFLSGWFRIFQLKNGHRYSTDDVLTAWYGTTWCPSARRALDLGSGIGSVAMIAAWRLPGARFVTIEAQDISVALAQKSARYNGLTERYEIRHADFRDPSALGSQEKFDLVLGSPPYFPLGSGVLGDHPQKVACRFETRGAIDDYCRVAATHLEVGGVFACVFPVQPEHQMERVREAALASGLTTVRWRPVVLREGEPPLLGLFAMTLSAHLPESIRARSWEEPALVIRLADGSVHPEYAAVKLAFGFPP